MVVPILLVALAVDAAQPLDRVAYVEEKLAEANSRRTTGIVLTVAGGAAVAGGVATIFVGAGQAARTDLSNPETVSSIVVGIGAGVAALGALSTTLGAVFWISGGREVAHYERKKDDLVLSLAPVPGGVVLAGRW